MQSTIPVTSPRELLEWIIPLSLNLEPFSLLVFLYFIKPTYIIVMLLRVCRVLHLSFVFWGIMNNYDTILESVHACAIDGPCDLHTKIIFRRSKALLDITNRQSSSKYTATHVKKEQRQVNKYSVNWKRKYSELWPSSVASTKKQR